MQWTVDDYTFMNRALSLARHGMMTTHPNPRVGCVLVNDREVISEGWHEYAGGPHAEMNAINKARVSIHGAGCYVTLEPCCHEGKTGPCTQAIIDAGISWVIIGMQDPNPHVSGKGMDILKDAGIDVRSGLYEDQARALNPGFLKRMVEKLPYVRCKMAMGVDAKTALKNGQSKWITSEASRRDVHGFRACSSAILTGINTVLDDDPALTVRDIDGISRQPVRVVLDRELKFPVQARMLKQDGRSLIFTLNQNPEKIADLKDAGAEVILIQGHKEAFIQDVLIYLGDVEQVNEVWLESGPTLAGAFLDGGFIDELIIYEAPVIMGNDGKGLFSIKELRHMSDTVELELLDSRMFDKDIRRIYSIKNRN